MKAYIIKNNNEIYQVIIAPNGICTHMTQIGPHCLVPVGVRLGKCKHYLALPMVVKLPGRVTKHLLRVYGYIDNTMIYEKVLPDQPELVSDVTNITFNY